MMSGAASAQREDAAADAEEQRVGIAATAEEQEEGSSGQDAGGENKVLSAQETTSKPMDIFEGERFDAVAFINRLFPDGMHAFALLVELHVM